MQSVNVTMPPEALFRCAVCVAHLDAVEEAQSLLSRCKALDPEYIVAKANWRPYADQKRNEHLLSGIRRHGLLP